MKPYDETHQKGYISFEQNMKMGMIQGDIGIQVAEDGRIWICVNGQALVRFKPYNNYMEELSDKYKTHMKGESNEKE